MNLGIDSRTAAIFRRDPARRSARAVEYAVPAVFVLLWASGFVVPRAFAPYAEPLSFVAARNTGAAAVLVLLALALGRRWPQTWADRIGLTCGRARCSRASS